MIPSPGVAHKAPPAQAALVGHKSGSGPLTLTLIGRLKPFFYLVQQLLQLRYLRRRQQGTQPFVEPCGLLLPWLTRSQASGVKARQMLRLSVGWGRFSMSPCFSISCSRRVTCALSRPDRCAMSCGVAGSSAWISCSTL